MHDCHHPPHRPDTPADFAILKLASLTKARVALKCILMLFLLTSGLGALDSWPRVMFNGGNQLIPEGTLQASSLYGIVVHQIHPDEVFPNARIQVQSKNRDKLFVNIQSDKNGRFTLPNLRPGGILAGRLSTWLQFWTLSIRRKSGKRHLRVELSLGT